LWHQQQHAGMDRRACLPSRSGRMLAFLSFATAFQSRPSAPGGTAATALRGAAGRQPTVLPGVLSKTESLRLQRLCGEAHQRSASSSAPVHEALTVERAYGLGAREAAPARPDDLPADAGTNSSSLHCASSSSSSSDRHAGSSQLRRGTARQLRTARCTAAAARQVPANTGNPGEQQRTHLGSRSRLLLYGDRDAVRAIAHDGVGRVLRSGRLRRSAGAKMHWSALRPARMQS
jgi:hypothetical protein